VKYGAGVYTCESSSCALYFKIICLNDRPGAHILCVFRLRHTWSKGDNIADVSNQLGHHSVKLTMDVYYHYMSGAKKSEVDGLDNLHPAAPC